MAVKTRSALKTQADSTIYANTSNAIDAGQHNTLLNDLLDSAFNTSSDSQYLFTIRKATGVAVTSSGTAVSFSSTIGSATYALLVTCYDASGNQIAVKITSRTATGFTATSAINGTIDYLAILI